MTTDARVTIIVAPRERFSLSERALASIYEQTKSPFRLIYVTGRAPDRVCKILEREAGAKGFELIHTANYLSPNQARNLAIPKVDTEFVAFLDNDALVAPHWLERLLQCADETGAWVVGPLYLIHEFERATIHMAGGRLWPEEQDGKHYLVDEQYLYDTPIAKADLRLTRRQCEYVEFHCMLARTKLFERTGLLDEAIYTLHEERDICLAAAQAGGTVYIEPKAVVTFVPVPPCEWWDLPYFMLRWSEEWSVSSVRRFNEKWNIAGIRHISDKSRVYEEGTVIGFSSGWRRRVAGMQFANSDLDPISPTDQSLLMVALLASVDRQRFALDVGNCQSEVVEQRADAPVSEIILVLAGLPDPGFNYRAGIVPLRRAGVAETMVVRLDALTRAQCDELTPLAFLVLQTSAQTYQCWFATPANAWRHARELVAGTASDAGEHPCTENVLLAGSLCAKRDTVENEADFARVRLLRCQVGRLVSEKEWMEARCSILLVNGNYY